MTKPESLAWNGSTLSRRHVYGVEQIDNQVSVVSSTGLSSVHSN